MNVRKRAYTNQNGGDEREVMPMGKVNKHILERYTDMREEERDLVRRIQSLDAKILNMETEGYVVADSVTCGRKGKKPLGTRTVRGFPIPDYQKKKERLKTLKLQLQLADEKLLEMTNAVEEYIQSITDSRIRRIMRYRYLDDMSWIRVAHRMGGKHTAEGCRKSIERYLLEEK